MTKTRIGLKFGVILGSALLLASPDGDLPSDAAAVSRQLLKQ